jgi:Domain of unknown function (DUF4832)/Domain of unknown function (DUF4874)
MKVRTILSTSLLATTATALTLVHCAPEEEVEPADLGVSADELCSEGAVELEGGQLAGRAALYSKSAASGGRVVGDMGFSGTVSVTFNSCTAGVHKMGLTFASGEARAVDVFVNGIKATTLSNLNSGSWTTFTETQFDVALGAGRNVIRFERLNEKAPDLDRLRIVSSPPPPAPVTQCSPAVQEAERATRVGRAAIYAKAGASGGEIVGDMGLGGAVDFVLSGCAGGSQKLTLRYASGEARELDVMVNGARMQTLTLNSSGWTTFADASFDVALRAGSNTVRFENADGKGPDIDKLTVAAGGIVTPTPTTTSTTPPPQGPTGPVTNVTFGKDDGLVRNPERGFLTNQPAATSTSWDVPNVGEYTRKATLGALQPFANSGYRLLRRQMVLNGFRTRRLTDEMLQAIDADFANARALGLKYIVHVNYTQNEDSRNWAPGCDASKSTPNEARAAGRIFCWPDTTLDWMKVHAVQLGPIMRKNADVVAVYQIGFIGRWGEWNKSTNGLGDETNPQNTAAQRDLVETVLGQMPSDRFASLRYYGRKQAILSDTSPLTASQAFEFSQRKARIGHFNDYFTLEDYSSDARNYLAAETRWLPQGGEPIKTGSESGCSYATEELARNHWTYMSQPGGDFESLWRSGGCWNDIEKKLGYRYFLTSAAIPVSANKGQSVTVTVKMRNEGYAGIFNPRGIELVLRNRSTGKVHRAPVTLAEDLRKVLPNPNNTEEKTIALTVALPSGAALDAGASDVLLNLPDPLLKDDRKYSIRLANTNTWEDATGYNRLGTINVQ